MKRLIFLLLIACCLLSQGLRAQVPVILRVLASEQHDTIGCNVVREIVRISHHEIMKGTAKLWNGPGKEIRILPASLQKIDELSKTSFLEQDIVFVYEFWNNQDGQLTSTTGGFLFSNKNRSGEDIEYGYVEYAELQGAFTRERIDANPNGNYNATLSNYIDSKAFHYNLIQFAGKVVDNVAESRRIRDEYVGKSRFNPSLFGTIEVPKKMVEWSLDPVKDASTQKASVGNDFLKKLDSLMKSNEDLFVELGGYELLHRQSRRNWKVTRLLVREIWKKVNNELLFDPFETVVFINDEPLMTMSYQLIVSKGLAIDDRNLIDCIRKKEFNYAIRKLNSQEVMRGESMQYQKALLTAPWNNITGNLK